MLHQPYRYGAERDTLHRYLPKHEWREWETGWTFTVCQGNGWQSFQVVAILPNATPNPWKGTAIIRHLGTGRTFTEPLGKLWADMDSSAEDFRSPVVFGWKDHTAKAIRRHNRKQAERYHRAIGKGMNFRLAYRLYYPVKGGAA